METRLLQGECRVISLVPLTGKGKAVYLSAENAAALSKPSFSAVWNHPQAATMHMGRKIQTGGVLAYHHAYLALRRWDGELILINGMASLENGVLKIE